MDEATRSEIDNMKEDIREVKEALKGTSCLQHGCRFMESQGKKPGTTANWLTSVGLLLLLLFEMYGVLS